MDSDGQTVVPVFYDVDPSHVRKRKRSFAEAFARHELDSAAEMAEVQSWKSALTRACNLSGWDSQNYKDDARLVEEIVQDIFDKLIHMSSSKGDGLVGMDSHLDEMNLRLCLGTEDVRFVGIWGMGGIGKTTIARAVYEEIACQFEAYCFLENVKEGFSRHGAIHMQEELLSRILKEKVRSLGTLDKGSKMIRKGLAKKKVFLVLDDVDNIDQIEGLLGKQRSFGCGSRIIITTRDVQLLNGVDAIYWPKFSSDKEARDLFMQYAFRTNQPTRDHKHLTCHAIEYARGLPLALKVLGAFLDNKSVREWEDVLEKIRKTPHRGIQDVLRTSFDGLDDSEDIFLDIACFFKGMKNDYAINILDGCGFYPNSGLRVLIDRSLITISDDGTIEMHDLLEEMGWEIVRQESIKEPGRRSRLWSYEDVHPVLTQNIATKAIESIVLDLSNKSEEVYLNAEAFAGMTRLRLLRIKYHYPFSDHDFIQHLSGDLKYLSHELRCLFWHGCPLKSLPSNFHPNNLVDLDMQYSNIQQLWEGTKHLERLKFINLNHSHYLERTPYLTEVKNLEELFLEDCNSLFEVHPSISSLQNLLVLSLRGCKELRKFPSSICMKSLKSLILSGCSSFEKFPEISDVMKELSNLHLDGIAIKELPSSIKNLTGLVTLNLKDCIELQSLPSSIYLRSLKYLNLSGCSNLLKFPEISEVMGELQSLCLDDTAIEELPSSISNLTGLCDLSLIGCLKLEKFPEILEVMEQLNWLYLDETVIEELPSSISNLTGLCYLSLKGCLKLKSLPCSICQLKSLKDFNLAGCSNLEKFPEISEVMGELKWLYLDGTAIEELPSSISNLTGLCYLSLEGCLKLKSLPCSICQLKFLKDFKLARCSNLDKFPKISEVMGELQSLCLDDTAIEELPSSISNLTGLCYLSLKGCLKLKSLPCSICQLKSLKDFNLAGCSNLEKFLERFQKLWENSNCFIWMGLQLKNCHRR
nr:disease resistance-like protein DSC1 [Malus domestica]